jgi:very-short-patch-repair endonuclease
MLRNHAVNRNLYYSGNRLPYNPDLVPFARDLRRRATKEERLIWKYLRTLSVNVFRQRPIDHYIVDFYIPAQNLVIEIDGGQHYSGPGKEYDAERTRVLMELGLSVIRFSNREVKEHLDEVCMQIWRELKI